MCSKQISRSKLNSQHILGGGGMMWSFKKKYKLQKSWQKRLQMISTNCMFHIMQVGLELKVTV